MTDASTGTTSHFWKLVPGVAPHNDKILLKRMDLWISAYLALVAHNHSSAQATQEADWCVTSFDRKFLLKPEED